MNTNTTQFTKRRASFMQALFPETTAILVQFVAQAQPTRATQREIDEQSERFTEAQRGKPQRINPHGE
jgi:hypothetical protein